jgi:hypothetical protein
MAGGRLAALIAVTGRTITLARPGAMSVAVIARLRWLEAPAGIKPVPPAKLVVTIVAAELAATGFAWPPRPGDQLAADGRTLAVESVRVIAEDGAPCLWRLVATA